MKLAEVAVNFPQKKTLDLLTYLIPADREVSPGDIVTVPLGKRKEIACVVKLISEKELKFDIKKIKPIEDFEDEVLRLSSKELALYQWVSSYYHYPLGKLIFDCLPNIHSVKPPKFSKLKKINFPFALDGIIKQYYDQILENSNQFSQWLVHGVTGSGKSILFYFLIKKILSEGKSVLLLVPEINLTPQFLNFYGQYLDETVYPYHSAVSSAKKFQIWMDAKTNDGPKLIIGARSSIFMPVKNLGAIFIDEEHDHSFKQDDRCHFHARSVAIKKAQLENIPVVLASATPSLETYTRFIADKKNYLPMKERFNNSKLPEVVKIKNPEYTDSSWPISPGDIELIKNNPADKFIFFVNKLGYSNYLLCRACGHKFECPNCSVSLTNYEKSNILSCHLCEYKIKRPNMCPECSCLDLSPVGFGTEKLEKVLTEYFPEKKILRFDRDEIKNQTQLVARLDEIYSGQFDILVGTQMIAKGHNIKGIKFISILGVDASLSIPDFRSRERVYQLATQVIGRAGRFGEEAVVKIYSDRNDPFFEILMKHDFHRFYQEEAELRKMFSYPPQTHSVLVTFISRDQKIAKLEAEKVADKIHATLRSYPSESLDIKGPARAYIEKIKNKYSFKLLILAKNRNFLHQVVDSIFRESSTQVETRVDVDPQNLI